MFIEYTAIVNRKGNKDKGDDEDGYKNTTTIEKVAIWQSIIDKKRANTAKYRAIYSIYMFFAGR
jgi:hypothetical protein